MKKIYSKPEVEEVFVTCDDIIETSGGPDVLKTFIGGMKATGLQSVEYTDIFQQKTGSGN